MGMVRPRPATVAASRGGRMVVRRRLGRESLRKEAAMIRYRHIEPENRASSARKTMVAMVVR